MIQTDSRAVRPGDSFVAVRGAAADGAAFVRDAVSAGARRVYSENPRPDWLPDGVEWTRVPDSRVAAARLACEDAGRPSERGLSVVGVTGTNGKTTIANLSRGILSGAGFPCSLCSTVEFDPNPPERAHPVPAANTTPGPVDLQRFFRDSLASGCRAAAIEVSSHALDQRRVDGTRFECAVFTNLTQDHLDYHGTMERYFEAKRRLFSELSPRSAVVNVDDPAGRVLVAGWRGAPDALFTYGFSDDAALRISDLELSRGGGSSFLLSVPGAVSPMRIATRLLGRHNALNAAAAMGVALAFGIGPDQAAGLLALAPPVRGRLEPVAVPGSDAAFFVDYAHTPDALRNVLRTLRELVGHGGRLFAVFGAGGDRDRGKRPLMGAVCAELADELVVTSDNPRSEDPDAIIADILAGVPADARSRTVAVADRALALRLAVSRADRAGDVVLVAGKGHETYQIFAGGTVHFDDREALLAAAPAGV